MLGNLLVIVSVLMAVELGVAQPNNDNNNTNTPLYFYCGDNQRAASPADLYGLLNSTFSQLKRKLSSNGVYYATAQNLTGNGEAVYGLAQCRNYLSATQCLGCIDAAVLALEPCGHMIGGQVYLDDCYLRYENNDQFYDDPDGRMDTGSPICRHESTSQPIQAFNKAVEGLLSDIRVATPRTSDFYTASARQVTNATVYAIGQCVKNISQASCKNCMDLAYNNLYTCLPSNKEGRAMGEACFMRYSEFSFFQDNQTINLVPFLSEGSSNKSGLIVGVASGASFVLLILVFFWYRRCMRKKSKSVVEEGGRRFSYQDLKLATNNFSDEYLLGKGGFGEVFKGIVDNGVVVAVKRLHGTNHRARKEFENEVRLISNVCHRNLMLQLGWCIDGPELLLVLEYVPNGSLDKFLWGENRGKLNWKQRCDIIFGIARGLAHLHDEYHVKIVHRDIKPSNILLDDCLQPKIADFGLARYYHDDQTHVSTNFAGTMGYIPPEYVTGGQLSEKVDIYSFGIVVLEVISGRRCSEVYYSGPRMEYLLDHAWDLYSKGMHFKLIDEALDPNKCEEENVMKIVEIALKCTQSPPSLRPTMSEVVLMLFSEPRTWGQRQMSRPTFIDVDRRIQIDQH